MLPFFVEVSRIVNWRGNDDAYLPESFLFHRRVL